MRPMLPAVTSPATGAMATRPLRSPGGPASWRGGGRGAPSCRPARQRPQPVSRLRALSANYSGDDLLSQGATPQVPSALAGLTSVFGMGTGVTPPLWPPETLLISGLPL